MILRSLVSHEGRLQPVEVEIELTPGLPQMHFLGLADQGIKESIYRIKCAVRQQGFEYPRTQQILVNLRPAHFRKSSRGLELAVAAGLLAKTEQIKWPELNNNLIVYGELSLSGEVREPDDLPQFTGGPKDMLLTGSGSTSQHVSKFFVRNLKNLQNSRYEVQEKTPRTFQRPILRENLKWSAAHAEWLKIMAIGGHSSLLAGPAGLGKTTLAQHLIFLLPEPEASWSQSYQKHFDALSWRPLVQPHHSTTAQALLGGCVPLCPGEISRAHGGALILDELLEFSPAAMEALREPLEEGIIRLRKGNHRATFPADFQLIATTNLCKCGDWVPGKSRNCHFSMLQCLSTLRRVTGPFLDRFQTVFFVKAAKPAEQTTEQVLAEVLKIFQFQKTQKRSTRNARLSELELGPSLDHLKLHSLEELSPRRRLSALRVARSLADLELSESITPEHIERSRAWTIQPFLDLKKGSC